MKKKNAKVSTNTEYEKTFLSYQIILRENGSKLLNEAMFVLDVVDNKTASLLSYISISLTALIFGLTSLPSSKILQPLKLNEKYLYYLFIALIIALMSAILLCLSCLNIIGANTIYKLKYYPINNENQNKYEEYVIKITNKRRRRYLFAQKISVISAIIVLIFFIYLLGLLLFLN